MQFEQRSHYSGHLDRTMNFNVYGHAGKPVIVFPTGGGTYHEFADFGMIEACSPWIEKGLIRVYTPESIDNETWFGTLDTHEKALLHERYDNYIIDNLIPLIKHETGWYDPMIVVGADFGAYHAANFGLRHPDVFDTVIGLSGLYDLRRFVGDYDDVLVYENTPTDYLWNLEDEWFLDHYRDNHFIFCCGRGSWEEAPLIDTGKLQEVFEEKKIPAWFDYWGYDVDHDWNWWRVQIAYYLGKLEEEGAFEAPEKTEGEKPQKKAKKESKQAPKKTAQKTEKKEEPKAEKKAEPKTEKKVEPKTEKKAEPKLEKKAEPKAEAKVASKTEKQTQPKTEKKAEPKAQAKKVPEEKPAKKAEKKTEKKVEKKPEKQQEKKSEKKAETTSEKKTGVNLKKKTVAELREIAKKLDVETVYKWRKAELIKKIEEKQANK